MNDIEQLLRTRGIRPTIIRTGVLSLLTESKRAYTHADLERAFNHSLDRVSLYRCLLTLTEAGLVQKHIDTKGICSYFNLPADTIPVNTAPTSIADDYPHFKCTQCETVVSLPKLPETYLALVRPFRLDTLRLTGEGTCNDCRHHTQDAIHKKPLAHN